MLGTLWIWSCNHLPLGLALTAPRSPWGTWGAQKCYTWYYLRDQALEKCSTSVSNHILESESLTPSFIIFIHYQNAMPSTDMTASPWLQCHGRWCWGSIHSYYLPPCCFFYYFFPSSKSLLINKLLSLILHHLILQKSQHFILLASRN